MISKLFSSIRSDRFSGLLQIERFLRIRNRFAVTRVKRVVFGNISFNDSLKVYGTLSHEHTAVCLPHLKSSFLLKEPFRKTEDLVSVSPVKSSG